MKILCFLFHRKQWIEFRSQNWVRKCIYRNGEYLPNEALFKLHKVECLCLKCGRSFFRKTYINDDEKIRAWVIDYCLKTNTMKETYKLEEMF
jgi:hypothetical protein